MPIPNRNPRISDTCDSCSCSHCSCDCLTCEIAGARYVLGAMARCDCVSCTRARSADHENLDELIPVWLSPEPRHCAWCEFPAFLVAFHANGSIFNVCAGHANIELEKGNDVQARIRTTKRTPAQRPPLVPVVVSPAVLTADDMARHFKTITFKELLEVDPAERTALDDTALAPGILEILERSASPVREVVARAADAVRCDVEAEWNRLLTNIEIIDERERQLEGLRRVIHVYEVDYYDRCRVEKMLTPDDAPVHLAVRNKVTKLFGCYLTPLEYRSTACRETWTEEPRRTLLPSLVTCPECRAYVLEHDLVDGWARTRR